MHSLIDTGRALANANTELRSTLTMMSVSSASNREHRYSVCAKDGFGHDVTVSLWQGGIQLAVLDRQALYGRVNRQCRDAPTWHILLEMLDVFEVDPLDVDDDSEQGCLIRLTHSLTHVLFALTLLGVCEAQPAFLASLRTTPTTSP